MQFSKTLKNTLVVSFLAVSYAAPATVGSVRYQSIDDSTPEVFGSTSINSGQQDNEVPAPSSTVYTKRNRKLILGGLGIAAAVTAAGRYSSARDVSPSSPSKASKSLGPGGNRKPRPREMVGMEVCFLLCSCSVS
jgi:hypothetical protein